jgi:hypothetical protein
LGTGAAGSSSAHSGVAGTTLMRNVSARKGAKPQRQRKDKTPKVWFLTGKDADPVEDVRNSAKVHNTIRNGKISYPQCKSTERVIKSKSSANHRQKHQVKIIKVKIIRAFDNFCFCDFISSHFVFNGCVFNGFAFIGFASIGFDYDFVFNDFDSNDFDQRF